MTKKDYVLIADVLRGYKNTIQKNQLINLLLSLGEAFKGDNPNFNYKRFKEYIMNE
jgi:hypothetical protein